MNQRDAISIPIDVIVEMIAMITRARIHHPSGTDAASRWCAIAGLTAPRKLLFVRDDQRLPVREPPCVP